MGIGYVIYKLGTMYMDSIGYSDTTIITVPNNSFTTDWISIAPVINNHIGMRSIAKLKPAGVLNCNVPITDFTASTTDICIGDTIIFTNSTTGADSYFWTFGSGATPSTDTSQGPLSVIFNDAGLFNVTLQATNQGGTTSATKTITVQDKPDPFFTTTIQGYTVNFSLPITSGADTWLWEFGDGDTSIVQNPVHTYDSSLVYQVSLYLENECGQSDTSISIDLSNAFALNSINKFDLIIYPNPGDGVFTLSGNNMLANADIIITDLNGKFIDQLSGNTSFNNGHIKIDLSQKPSGIYILQVKGAQTRQSFKLIKQ